MKIIIFLAAIGLATACGTALATEYGIVVSSTPVTVQVTVPREQCVDEQGYVQAPTSGGGAVVGGVLGGLAGHAIGAGAGRALATGIGVVAGAIAGNQVEAATTAPLPVTTSNCTYGLARETRIIGYDVVYDFNGQRRTARLARDPGDRVALDVTAVAESQPNADVRPQTRIVQADSYPVPYPPAYPPAPYGAYPYGPPVYGDGPYGYAGVPVYVGGQFVFGGRGRRFR